MILLSAQNIAKTYMERKVLDGVSFFLNEGDKVGIIGINGTGKSTLLRILAGAEEPDSGNVIRTNGIRISYLPQIPEFEPHGSVLEQVMLHLPADLKEAKTFEAKSILGKLGITDETRDISTLSGGEKRRAGIAAALIQPSDVLLLDEPTSNLDIRNQYQVLQITRDLCREQNLTAMIVIHDLNLALRFCDRFLLLREGEVYRYGGAEIFDADALRDVYGVTGSIVDVQGHRLVLIDDEEKETRS